MTDAPHHWRELHRAACEPYRRSGRFAWHFARGKLGRDPFFRHMLESGLASQGSRVLDIGSGQGLLASLLTSCSASAVAGRWPLAWPAAPRLDRYLGIELMSRDVQRAERALAGDERIRFVCADMCQAAFPPSDLVVILDVLHYVDHAAQAAVLERVRQALMPRGRLLLRVGDLAQSRGYAVSQWVDRLVTRVRGHRVAPTFGRSVAQWRALLEQLGFEVQTQAMSQGTPFANTLLVCDLIPAVPSSRAGSGAAG